ncbi:MAG: hypothetical protein A2231_08120 [Candidatus Firestonebacteria bacterium RIFOXYA2_FULL_40_8]|nr:MAG: hypothetical protein A2231_08120 [Candidatus Firestonebacteria bacterium RIFOXYA2_FULL_40_8]
MKKMRMVVFGAAVCLFVSGMLLAQEGPKQGEGKGRGPVQGEREIKTDCKECQPLADQMKVKRGEIKVLIDQIKTLEEARKAKRETELEELKKTDPKKYEEQKEKMEKRKKEMEDRKEGREGRKEWKKEGKDGERREGPREGKEKRQGPSQERLEKMKTENPEMFNIMTQLDAKQKEMRALHEQLRECEREKGGKDSEKKEKN